MITSVTELEPKRLYQYFYQINQIPRCSKNEQKVGEYLLSLAKEKGIDAASDGVGNIVMRVPATPGKQNAPTIILQAHTDMVCEKNKSTRHDFSSDPIAMSVEGDWLAAQGTTLGADNGIGVAAALAVIDEQDAVHGPLELLFTVDEETGLTGANHLEEGFISGKTLINMDSEEEGVLYIGCAGGKDTIGELPVTYKDRNREHALMRVVVEGLKGGHSGIEIHLGRANAIKLLARTLAKIYHEYPFHLAAIEGGSKRNAIPREAEALLSIDPRGTDAVHSMVESMKREFRSDYVSTDPKLDVRCEAVSDPIDSVFSLDVTKAVLGVLNDLPHGVIDMSADVPGLVETSTNLATIVAPAGAESIIIGTSQRSAIDSERDIMSDKVAHRLTTAGFTPRFTDGYPGWKPNLGSNVLAAAKSILSQYYESDPEVKAIHAGLECGIIGRKFPGMDMISFGPTITGAHSPDERVHIPSVRNFYTCVLLILKKLAG
jgi:dipeptidase D